MENNKMEEVVEGIYRYDDGILRWTYEFNMWKKPQIFLTTWKVLLISSIIVLVFLSIINFEGDIIKTLSFAGVFMAIAMVVITVLALIGYIIVALNYGGKYQVIFEMGEESIVHIQMEKQVKKMEVLALLGIATMQVTTMGSSILALSKTSLTSNYKKVKKITAYPHKNIIYLNGNNFNQIYVTDQQFDFVYKYISMRCPKARAIIK